MSFGSIISGLGSMVGGLFGGGIGGTILKTAVAGFSLYAISNSIKKSNTEKTAAESQNQVPKPTQNPIKNEGTIKADQNAKIPVIYGTAFTTGLITEAVMSNNNTRMTIVYTLSEKTGVKLSDGTASTFALNEVFAGEQRLVFDTSGALAGIQVAYSTDTSGNQDKSMSGVVRVYFYNGNSTSPQAISGYGLGTTSNAYDVVPGWTSSHAMNDLIFAVAQFDYNPDKGMTSIPEMKFRVQNTMTQPGDVMNDYMSNTRYGAGIPAGEIYSE